ncbi:MAG: helix-turn-helix domain-containing protein [Steroidobacteraceae bacterium]
MGDLPLCEVHCSPAIVEHSSAHVARMHQPLFLLCLQIHGESVYRQAGREAHLRPGDFTLIATECPYEMVFPVPDRVLVIALSEERLRPHLACPQGVVASRMSYSENQHRMLSDLARGIWQECLAPRANGSNLEWTGASLSSALLHLIGGAYASPADGSLPAAPALEKRRLSVLQHIERHFRDSTLTPDLIAAHFRMSLRSLHALFSNQPETLCRYILRRRLEESARVLASTRHRGHTVSDIAFDNGFSSGAHFCRVFRDHFRVTPSEYRQERSAAAPTPIATASHVP